MNEPAAPVHSIEFALTPRTQRPFYRWWQEAIAPVEAWHKRRMMRHKLIAAACAATCLAIYLLMRSTILVFPSNHEFLLLESIVGLCILGLVFFYKSPSNSRIEQYFVQIKQAAAGIMPWETILMRLDLEPDHLRQTIGGISTLVPWTHVDEVIEKLGFIALLLPRASQFSVLSVPRDTFKTPEDFTAFCRELHAYHLAARPDQPSPLDALLKKTPLPCPKCSYQLTAMSGSNCPECGVELSASLLQLWQWVRVPGGAKQGF